MKPILFNTEMVRAILDNRKNVTRRVAKIKINGNCNVDHAYCETVNYPEKNIDGICANFYEVDGHYKGAAKPPYQIGDILYVRETWAEVGGFSPRIGEFWQQYIYRATYKPNYELDVPAIKWRPSIHMPKEAARLFLRVTDVRVELLQDVRSRPESSREEGQPACHGVETCGVGCICYTCDAFLSNGIAWFAELWDSTIKPEDLHRYGWDANPWVWVIEFERITKEEAMKYEAD